MFERSSELKYFYCKKCEIMLIPGKTCRIRVKCKKKSVGILALSKTFQSNNLLYNYNYDKNGITS